MLRHQWATVHSLNIQFPGVLWLMGYSHTQGRSRRVRLHFRDSSGRGQEEIVTSRGSAGEEWSEVFVGTAANHGCQM